MHLSWGLCARGGAKTTLGVVLMAVAVSAATAQPARQPATPPPPVVAPPPTPPSAPVTQPANPRLASPSAVPGFWDPRRRPERPDLTRISVIRFLTETDYPPFDFAGPDGAPAGFNVDLARMICEEIKVACTVQMRRFDTLIDALNKNQGDAIIASIAETPEMRTRVDFSDPYYRTPARFVSRKDVDIEDVRPQALEGKKIGVVAGTAHEAYLNALSTEAELHPYPNADAARSALRRGEVDLLFGDGISLAFWLNGTDSAGCCVFRGGPYLESRYFGEGVGIAVKKGNVLLRQAFNWALFQLWEKGRFTDLWLRYFPISPF
jgi:polar amino acid transport system substrate-binding protein